MSYIVSDTDILISVFEQVTTPRLDQLFIPKTPFMWDKSVYSSPDTQNNLTVIPTRWDTSIHNIPTQFFQSGHGHGDDLKLDGFINRKLTWVPRIKHGNFFIENTRQYLYSDGSIMTSLDKTVTTDGHSRVNLLYTPKTGVPITASRLTNTASGHLTLAKEFKAVTKFSGKILNGHELETTGYPENIDTTKAEFIVHRNSNYVIRFKIPSTLSQTGHCTLQDHDGNTLVPLDEYSLIFDRPDIFKERKSNLNDTTSYGDYYVGADGILHVNLEGHTSYIDYGTVLITWDYPAWLEFNNDYVEDVHSDIVGGNVTIDDTNVLLECATANGSADFIFTLPEFPIMDTNFHLFVVTGEPNSQIITEWTRVTDLEAQDWDAEVFTLNACTGEVRFGDGVNEQGHGQIPANSSIIYCGLQKSVFIEYEPSFSTNYWTNEGNAEALNIHPLADNLNSGYLLLSRKNITEVYLSLLFTNSTTNTLQTNKLIAYVTDTSGNPVRDQYVNLMLVEDPPIGSLAAQKVFSDATGSASTTYYPPIDLSGVGVFAHFFQISSNPDTVGIPSNTSPVVNTEDPKTHEFTSTLTLPFNVYSNDSEQYTDIYIFTVDADDAYNKYDHVNRTRGRVKIIADDHVNRTRGRVKIIADDEDGEPLHPTSLTGNTLTFDQALPIPKTWTSPEGNKAVLRSLVIVGQRQVRARAKVTYRNKIVYSNIATIQVGFSPVQLGQWYLPMPEPQTPHPPGVYDQSAISRATWFTLDNDDG